MKKALFAISSLWLGHATRTLPIINFFLEKWYKIDIICFWNALNFLRNELENKVTFYEYEDYPALERWDWLKFYYYLIYDILKTHFLIQKEQKFVENLQEKNNYNFIFSDWKYWSYSKKTKSFILSHQLSFDIPKAFWFSQSFMDSYNKKVFSNFNYLFIPDFENKEKNLAWKLSHPKWLKKLNYKYIWILSSLNKKIFLPSHKVNWVCSRENPLRGEWQEEKKEKIDFLFTISWYLTEHKDSFVKKLIEESKVLPWKKVFILWETNKNYHKIDKENNIEIFSFLAWEERKKLFENAEIIVSRAGYTTIMDLVELEKKAILFPTPNQTEQEYLSKYLWEKKYFVNAKENENLVDLVKKLDKINTFKTKEKTKNALEKIYKEINNLW